MSRVNTKIGDVFIVQIGHSIRYFQYIATDSTQLNSDVIRAFKKKHLSTENLNISAIVQGEVDFYAHCITKLGIKFGLWEKVGNTSDIGELNHIIFRGTSDYGIKKNEKPIKVSQKWFIWKIGDRNFTMVGKLYGENRKAEIGLVMTPYDIIDRLTLGKYTGFYPDFE